MKARRSVVTAAVLTAAALGLSSVGASATPFVEARAGSEAGTAAKAAKNDGRPTVQAGGKRLPAANPYLALLPDISQVDWAYWKAVASRKSAAEASQLRSGDRQVPVPFAYDEQEPEGTSGSNDTADNAERISGFGSIRPKRKAVRILGELFAPRIPTPNVTTTEDQGSIPLATDTGIPAVRDGARINSEIGDGPHGSSGTGSGDFDFFKVSASAGQTISLNTAGSDFDTLATVWTSTGELVALNDDVGFPDLTSAVRYQVPTDGDYYAMVSGFFSLPDDPFDSGSGTGAGDEGDYTARITVGQADADYYSVFLRSGDTLGGVIEGGSPDLTVTRPSGRESIGSTQDASFIYPAESPLPGGGNATFAYVAEKTGWYSVSTEAGTGDYNILLEVYRPGSETKPPGTRQALFIDFDGERVNTAVWGGPGVRTLSPLASFLARWDLTNADLDDVISQILATVRENVRADLINKGLNPNLAVRIVNSRDQADTFGRANVSRVIVGGTIEQSGIPTIGIASSIDPGNYEGEDDALVLLDVLSGPDDDDASLNFYLRPRSDRVEFIGTAIGNVVAHEIGHYVGSFHVDQFNRRLNLMDQGGNFPLLYGVGDDGVGGTADDPDVDFGTDRYNPFEGFTGSEDTLNNSAWAFVAGQGR